VSGENHVKPKFKKLLEPMNIGKVTVKNRLFKGASGSRMMFGNNGFVNERGKAWYEAIAKGGVGCVFVESPAIDEPLSLKQPGDFRIDDDKYIPGLKELADVIQRHDCHAFLQFYHAGPWHLREISGLTPVSASPHGEPEFKGHETIAPCEELSTEKIQIIEEQFISAAERAAKAGFDGVEINAGANHLLATFLSRYWNYRHDTYGCDTYENRARIVVNIISGIKKRIGLDYPVTVILSGIENKLGDLGITVSEAQELAKLFEKAGADAFHVRAFEIDNPACYWPEFYFYPEEKDLPKELDLSRKGPGFYVPVCDAIKKVISKPVMTTGRWDYDLEYAEEVLQKGRLDAVCFVRGLQADTDLARKIIEGRRDDIKPCTSCMTCIEGHQLVPPPPIVCRINPFLGGTKKFNEYPQADQKKKVLVAGAGPAGMEAARVAALRGHDLTLYSRENFLGGLMNMAAVIKGNLPEDVEKIISYYKTQLKKLNVHIKTGKDVDLKVVEKLKPDAVIVATGAVATDTVLPGSDKRNVIDSTELRSQLNLALKLASPSRLNKATKFWMPLGDHVVVMGGDIKSVQLAEFLVKRRKKVTIVWEGSPESFGEGMNLMNLFYLVMWLDQKAVTRLPNAKYEEITDQGLVITNREGKRQIIKADSICPVTPLKKNAGLFEILRDKVPEVVMAGSCRQPGLIIDAIKDGSAAAIGI